MKRKESSPNAGTRIPLTVALVLIASVCIGAQGDSSYQVDGATRQLVQTILQADQAGEKLECEFSGDGLRVVIPAARRTPYDDVVVVQW
jgi:predicted RND superfamily exporter protein